MEHVNIYDGLSIFVPNSSGKNIDIIRLTLQSAKRTIPLLSNFAAAIQGKTIPIVSIDTFVDTELAHAAADGLKIVFDQYGSDKAASHDYHKLYGHILRDNHNIKSVLEVGMGTNNADVVSNMGSDGKPGASLRAFRDFLPNAQIYGADVDDGILFQEDRITTYFVDQTNINTFKALELATPSSIDLIIDDGLHSPDANITFLMFALKKLSVGGWVVIEDIAKAALPFWEIVAALLPPIYKPYLISGAHGYLFAINMRESN